MNEIKYLRNSAIKVAIVEQSTTINIKLARQVPYWVALLISPLEGTTQMLISILQTRQEARYGIINSNTFIPPNIPGNLTMPTIHDYPFNVHIVDSFGNLLGIVGIEDLLDGPTYSELGEILYA